MRNVRYSLTFFLIALLCAVLCACNQPMERSEIVFCEQTYAVGSKLPAAEDFLESLPKGWTVRFAQDYQFDSLGEYTLSLILTDPKGFESEHEVHFFLVLDEEPPRILGVSDRSALVGSGISYRSGVTVEDNCAGKVTLTVDSSQVDPKQVGEYPVYYIATDAAGNQTVVEARVYFYAEEIGEEALYAEIDRIIAQEIPKELSKEEQVRLVYEYVYSRTAYSESSNKSDWIAAAYDGLRTGAGDCFTYFALSKAFFVRLGIDNMDIQRTTGIVDERHYWNLVNIGTKEEPRWYHYDATRLSGVQHSGCLLTDLQVQAYTRQRVDKLGQGNYFYVYDTEHYPKSAEKIITATPALEPYY